MNLWKEEHWKEQLALQNQKNRTGLRFRFDTGIHQDVRNACMEFGKWLRAEYAFPVRIPVYFRNVPRLRCIDGDWAYETFFCPDDRWQEPYIRIAVGDYNDLLKKWGKDNALATYLLAVAYGLTLYYQWINDVGLSERGKKRQATVYSKRVLNKYADTRDHL